MLKDDLEAIKNILLYELDDTKAIYLFGSFAKGLQTNTSDYDIAVITTDYPPNSSIIEISTKLETCVDRSIDLVILKMEDIEHPSLVLYELNANHVLLWGTDIIRKSEKVQKAIARIDPIFNNGVVTGYNLLDEI